MDSLETVIADMALVLAGPRQCAHGLTIRYWASLLCEASDCDLDDALALAAQRIEQEAAHIMELLRADRRGADLGT